MNRILKSTAVAAAALSLAAFGFSQAAGPKNGAQGQQPSVKGGKAQGQQGDRMRMGRKMREEIYAKLELSAAQKKKISDIDTKFQAEAKKLRDAPGDRQTKGPQMRALFEQRQKAVGAVLTPAQRKKLEVLMAEMRKKMQAERGEGRPGKKGGAPAGTNPPPKG